MIINQIAKGGGDENPTAGPNDVIFYDYDGTIRYSYSVDEFLALTTMPPNPKHEGLTSQGWGWTLADAKTHVQLYEDGGFAQYYEPQNEEMWLDISVDFDTARTFSFSMSYGRTQGADGYIQIDWGDGSPIESYGPGYSSNNTSHTYASTGNYKIKLYTTEPYILINIGFVYSSGYFLRRVFLSKHFNSSSYTFRQDKYDYLDSISFPLSTLNLSKIPGDFMYMAKSIRFAYYINDANGQFGNNAFRNMPQVRTILLPKGIASIVQYGMMNDTQLLRVYLPDSLTSIDASAFQSCSALNTVRIPQGVTSIGSMAFQSCSALTELWFFPTVTAAVANVNAWTSIPTTCIVYVPFSALAAYLTATNYPDPATYTYIGFATYESGVTLPTQDNTQAYNVVWYASKEDAASQTNPITVGNGKRVYCRYTAV